jgi:hypothetical protein
VNQFDYSDRQAIFRGIDAENGQGKRAKADIGPKKFARVR